MHWPHLAAHTGSIHSIACQHILSPGFAATGTQTQMGDTSFGCATKLAIINLVPAEVEKEPELMQEMRVKLGPAPDQQRLLFHLRSARGKIHWAVNSYLRELMGGTSIQQPPVNTSQEQLPAQAQHSPRPSSPPASPAASPAGSPTLQPEHPPQPHGTALDGMPVVVLEAIVGWLEGPADVLRVCSTCRTLHQVGMSDSVWHKLFHQRWGDVAFPTHTGWAAAGRKLRRMPYPGPAAPPTVHPGSTTAQVPSAAPAASLTSGQQPQAGSSSGEGPQAQPLPAPLITPQLHTSLMRPPAQPMQPAQPISSSTSWYHRYRRQAGYERGHSCPCCGRTDSHVVPIVYGFPSPALLQRMRNGELILGGDHLIQNCHCWACTTCNASFRTYPYESPHLWRADHEELALKSSANKQQGQGGGAGGGGGGGAAAGDQQAAAAQGAGDEDDDDLDALPMYTYEL